MRSLAENIKVRLSNENSATVEIDLDQQRKYRRTLNREEFEALILPWVDKTITSCQRALADAHVEPNMIDQSYSSGAARAFRWCAVESRRPRAGTVHRSEPGRGRRTGSGVQAGVLGGVRRDALLLDVIPLSLGIETLGGAMSKLILRNSRIPCQATERFSTFVDGQTNIKINVLQGERELAENCRSLGEFELRGIPPMRGNPQAAGDVPRRRERILNVSAREERSSKEASIQIVPTHGLTPDEVKRMELESIAHAREDMKATS